MSQSKISRIEKGKVLPTVVDVERILKALEVPADDVQELLALARVANIEFRSGRAIARVGTWRRQLELKALVETTEVFRHFFPAMPTGLVQSPKYVSLVMEPKIPSSPERDVAKAVQARLELQKVLDDQSRRFILLTTEQAVRWNYADCEIMAEQVAHMASEAARPNIQLAVIPLSAQIPKAPMNTFAIHDERLVTVELFNGSVSFRDPRDVQHYLELFEFFLGHALTGDDAIAFLTSVAREFM